MRLRSMMDVAAIRVFPAEAMERERESQIAAIRAEQAQPQVVARNMLRSEIYGRPSLRAESAWSRGNCPKNRAGRAYRQASGMFHLAKRRFSGFAVDFDSQRILEMIEAQLQKIRSRQQSLNQPVTLACRGQFRKPAGHIPRRQASGCGLHRIILPALWQIRIGISLEILDEATGDSSSRFFVKVREELGLAYSVGSSLFLGVAPGIFSVHAATAPEKVERVSQILSSELRNCAKHGLEQQEFERAKTRTLSQLAFQLQNMDAYAHSVALNEFYGLGYDYVHRRKKQIESLTIEFGE